MTGLLFRHALLPAAAPVSIVALYFTGVTVFGCVNRGLLAVAITLVAAMAAVVTTVIGTRARTRRDPHHQYWTLSTMILLIAVALLIGLH